MIEFALFSADSSAVSRMEDEIAGVQVSDFHTGQRDAVVIAEIDQGIVAAFDNRLGRFHSTGEKILSTWIEYQILIGNDEPGRLDVPGSVECRFVEGGMVDGLLLTRENFSFLFRQIRAENSWKGGLVDRQVAFGVGPKCLNTR